MAPLDTGALLWRCGGILVACTLINGLLLFFAIRFLKFGKVSLSRSLLASTACSATVALGFLIPTTLALQGCSFVGAFLPVLGAIIGIVLTFPIQLAMFRLSPQSGIVVWLAYAILTPLVVLWIVVLSAWTGIV